MNGSRDLFFAGPGLADNQYGGGRIGHLGDEVKDIHHAQTLAQHILERMPSLQLFPKSRHLVLQRALAQRPLHHQHQMLGISGFG